MRHVTPAQRVAARFERQGRRDYTEADFLPAVDKAIKVFQDLKGWIGKFPRVLQKAQSEARGLSDGWVWQDRFVLFWKDADKWQAELREVDEVLDWLYLTSDVIADEANMARDATYKPPPKARIEHAFGKFDFFTHPDRERDHIAYSVERLKEWEDAFEKWTQDSIRLLEREKKTAKRKLRRKGLV